MNKVVFILSLLAVTGCFQKNDKKEMQNKEKFVEFKIKRQRICDQDYIEKQERDKKIDFSCLKVNRIGGDSGGGDIDGKIFLIAEDK